MAENFIFFLYFYTASTLSCSSSVDELDDNDCIFSEDLGNLTFAEVVLGSFVFLTPVITT